jgi:hypothetical protein
MERWRAHAAAVVVAALALGLAAGGEACGKSDATEPPIPGVRRIVSLSRTGSLACPGGGESFSFNDGELYAGLRAELLEPANFGPSGRVPLTLELRPSIDLIRGEALGRADILVVNRPRGTTLDDPAIAALQAFVAGGGALLSLGDARQTFLGAPGACAADPQATTVDGGPGVALVLDGPFGAVGPTYVTGYNCAFTDLGPGVAVISENSQGPNALMQDDDAGPALAIGDEEAFSSLAVARCASGPWAPGTPNKRLALNAFAYLAGATP